MIHFLNWTVAILASIYALLLLAYRYWFSKLKPFESTQTHTEFTRFTVVIPARNEAANIKACLDSILAQDYPKEHFEVIVIDDFSEDDTAFIVKAFGHDFPNVCLLSLADYFKPGEMNSFKKKAIEKAVSQANGQWIVTTDADCIIPKQWLSIISLKINRYLLRLR
jgi:glycosyltransferase involved in cell wall biosynthesis